MSDLIIKNENSPLEEKMEAALKAAGLRYKSQFTLMNKLKDQWNARYILDFLIYGEHCKIAVECDGTTYHSSRLAQERDLKRDLWVKRNYGIDDTLRFDTEQIKYNIAGVINQIRNAVASYDKLHYEKKQKALFEPNSIPVSISKKDTELLMQSIAGELAEVCKRILKNNKVRERRKAAIVKETRKLIDRKGFANIYSHLSSFALEDLAAAQQSIDILFGAFNTPCIINVVSDLKELTLSDKIMKNSSILKIILIFGSAEIRFKGKSYVIIDGVGSQKNKVIASDILPSVNQNNDAEQFNKLLDKASKLEKQLRSTYQSIYQKKSFKKSMRVEPFKLVTSTEREKLLFSISQFVIVNQSKSPNENKESADIAIDWYRSEGVYFKGLPFTLHELAIVIQYYRNRLGEQNKKM